MQGYYDDNLSAERLRRCYEIAPPGIQQYLQAEIEHVCSHITPGDSILELGCGYGRVLGKIAEKCTLSVGIDTSFASLSLVPELSTQHENVVIAQMDAANTGFATGSFDVVVCIQNGISAFHVDKRKLIEEAVRITRPDGKVLFSTYSEKFWNFRLEWFELQAQAGLIGEIDYDKTGDGVIVCRDGFRATTVSLEEFHKLTSGIDGKMTLREVDESSLFCEIIPNDQKSS